MSLNEVGLFIFDIVFATILLISAIVIIREVWND